MKSRINPFFIEMIIVITFFALSVSVIIQFFAASHIKGNQNINENIAMIKAQSLTEEVKIFCGSDLNTDFLDGYIIEKKDGYINAYKYYTSDWEDTDASENGFKISLDLTSKDTDSGTMIYSDIYVYQVSSNSNEDTQICRLGSNKYISEGQN